MNFTTGSPLRTGTNWNPDCLPITRNPAVVSSFSPPKGAVRSLARGSAGHKYRSDPRLLFITPLEKLVRKSSEGCASRRRPRRLCWSTVNKVSSEFTVGDGRRHTRYRAYLCSTIPASLIRGVGAQFQAYFFYYP